MILFRHFLTSKNISIVKSISSWPILMVPLFVIVFIFYVTCHYIFSSNSSRSLTVLSPHSCPDLHPFLHANAFLPFLSYCLNPVNLPHLLHSIISSCILRMCSVPSSRATCSTSIGGELRRGHSLWYSCCGAGPTSSAALLGRIVTSITCINTPPYAYIAPSCYPYRSSSVMNLFFHALRRRINAATRLIRGYVYLWGQWYWR